MKPILLAAVMTLGMTLTLTSARGAGVSAIEHGRSLFISYNCYICHGRVGQGGAGPTISPPALPDRAAFMQFVRTPAPADMPPYTTSVLNDADLGAIWTYLKSLPPPPKSLPPELERLKSTLR